MAVDTPAAIAVIGAGPIGLEAALYARYLGYDVRVYERARVVESLLAAPAAAPGVSWQSSTSPLGIAALAAQRRDWQPPAANTTRTNGDAAAEYFLPLAASDLLVDSVLVGTEVLSIERDASPDEQPVAEDEVPGFRLHVRDAAGERVDTADVVIDASGAGAAAFQVLRSTGEVVDAERDQSGEIRSAEGSTTNLDPRRLITAEMDFYVLGAKSAPSGGSFTFLEGLAQIRDLFTIIGDRATLDLYATIGAER
jgi:flavin-dependent dehydrogenase